MALAVSLSSAMRRSSSRMGFSNSRGLGYSRVQVAEDPHELPLQAAPVRDPVSARITSAKAAKLAVTPPVVGSVRTET